MVPRDRNSRGSKEEETHEALAAAATGVEIRVQPRGWPSVSGLDHAPSTANSSERAASAW